MKMENMNTNGKDECILENKNYVVWAKLCSFAYIIYFYCKNVLPLLMEAMMF